MKKMLLEGKYAELEEFCKTQLSINPEDIEILFHYASVLEALGKHEKAEKIFSKLFRITNDRLFLICRAIPKFREGSREDAVEELKKVRQEEESVDTLLFLFEVAMRNGETDVAGEAFYKAFKKDHKKAIAYFQEFFEKSRGMGKQKRILIASILMLLKEFGEETREEAKTP